MYVTPARPARPSSRAAGQSACQGALRMPTGRDDVEVKLQPASVAPLDLPDSLLRYVIRTQESVILDDASVENLFSEDEYVRQKRPRSILCLPLVKQAKIMGVLYLENNLAPGDKIQLQQVLLNLVVNGIEAMSRVVDDPRELCVSSRKVTEIPRKVGQETVEGDTLTDSQSAFI